MKLALFLNRDIYCNVVLNELVPGLASHDVSVFYTETVGRASALEALDRLKLIERDIPYECVFSRPDGAGELMSDAEIESQYGIPFEPLPDPNAANALEKLHALSLDVVVSIRYGRIFGDTFVALPRLGVLNLHSGLLPSYRGVMATFRALQRGDDELGCTLHWIDDPSIDTGPIISEWRRPVDPDASYFAHVLSLYPPGARLILDALSRLERGEELPAACQDDAERAYYSFPTEQDIVEFERAGHEWFRASEYRELLSRYQVFSPPEPGEERRALRDDPDSRPR